MAWAYVQDNTDATIEDYDRVADGVGDPPPDGLIVHVAGERGAGFRIIDVWESEDAYNRFRDERLRPAVEAALGADAMAQGPPPIDALDVHHLVKGS